MEDRELLEMAAKAGGIEVIRWGKINGAFVGNGSAWTPLTNDGDALRLAVKLRFEIQCYPGMGGVIYDDGSPDGGYVQQNPEAGQSDEMAVRRAIVRAAAIIGKNMP